jgi:hypothetical protein
MDSLPTVLNPEDDLLCPTSHQNLQEDVGVLLDHNTYSYPGRQSFTLSQMPAVLLSHRALNTSAGEETSSLSPANLNASDGELRNINRPSSSPNPRARYSLLKKTSFDFTFRTDTEVNKTA